MNRAGVNGAGGPRVAQNRPFFARAAAACGGVAVLMALTAPPALAQDDDLTFEQRLIHNLLGGASKPPIDYRERSPLVIPPSSELPPPEGAAAAVAGVPAWPNDPDIRRRKHASAAANSPAIDLYERGSRPLSVDELRRGTVRGGPRSGEPVQTPGDAELGRPMTPAQLGDKKSLFSGLFGGAEAEQPVALAGEPKRSRLIDPPTGYRMPAPTQPYAPPKEDRAWYKPFSWFDRGTEAENR